MSANSQDELENDKFPQLPQTNPPSKHNQKQELPSKSSTSQAINKLPPIDSASAWAQPLSQSQPMT